jgi:hypothetical protein
MTAMRSNELEDPNFVEVTKEDSLSPRTSNYPGTVVGVSQAGNTTNNPGAVR